MKEDINYAFQKGMGNSHSKYFLSY